MSKMTNCQNDHGGRELNGEPTHTIIWEPYGILQSFVPHSLHSFNDFILLFIHSFPIRLLSHSFSYSSTLTVIPFNFFVARKRDIVVDRKNIQKWSFLRHDSICHIEIWLYCTIPYSENLGKNNMLLLKSYQRFTAMAAVLVAPPANERYYVEF